MTDSEAGGRGEGGAWTYDSVADIGELYDHVGMYNARADIAFYVDVARDNAGRVLEVGCGTGRVLLPTARAGVTITGVDRSRAMLDRCRAKLASEPADVRARVTLQVADMRELALDDRYDLITAPFRSMQHLITVADQERFLRASRARLHRGGRLIFDVFNPDPRLLATPSLHEQEDTPSTSLSGRRTFRRTSRVLAIDHETQVSSIELTYYIRDDAGAEEKRVQAFPMRWFFPDDLRALVERCGFRIVAMFGGFDRTPMREDSREIIIVAERPA